MIPGGIKHLSRDRKISGKYQTDVQNNTHVSWYNEGTNKTRELQFMKNYPVVTSD